MALSAKTISEFQQEYTSVGYDKVETELKNLLALLSELKSAQTVLQNALIGGGGAKSEAVQEAKENFSQVKQAIGFRRERLRVEQDIDRVRGDLAQRELERRDIQSKADAQYEKDFQKLVESEAKAQAVHMKNLEAASAAEVRRVQMGIEGSKLYTAAKEAEYKANAEFYRNLEKSSTAALSKQQETANKALQSSQKVTQDYAFRVQMLKSTGNIAGLDTKKLPNLQISDLSKMQERLERAQNIIASKLTLDKLPAARVDFLKNQYDILGKQIREVDRALTSATRAKEKWDKQHTLSGWILNFWEKLKTVFFRVLDALISFAVINTTIQLIGAFTKSIIESNAQLEVLDARLSLMTGSGGAFDKLKKQIIDLTINTPFIIKEFIDASVSLQAFGLKAEKYLKPIADWASAIGKDIADVSVAFSKISTGSPRTALLLSTRGISKADFDKEFAKTQDRAVALANIVERRFGGMAERVSQTFTGMLSNIQDAWFLLSSALGEDLFKSIRVDVVNIFTSLRSWAKDPPVFIKAISVSIKGLYEVIKIATIGIGVFLALKLGAFLYSATGLVYGLRFAMHNLAAGVSVATRSIASFSATIYGASLIIGAIVYVIIDLISKNKALKETTDAVNEATRTSGKDSENYIFSLKKRIAALKDLNSEWSKFQIRNDIFGSGDPNKEIAANEVNLRLEIERLRISERLNAERKIQLDILREQITLLDTLELKKEIEGKIGGEKVRDAFLSKIENLLFSKPIAIRVGDTFGKEGVVGGLTEDAAKKVFQEINDRAKRIFGKALPQLKLIGPEFQGVDKIFGTIDPKQANELLTTVEGLRKTLIDKKVLEGNSVEEAYKNVDTSIQSILANGGGLEKIREFFKENLVDEPKTKGGKGRAGAWSDLSDEILRIRKEFDELESGSGRLFSKMQGDRVRLAEIIRQNADFVGPLNEKKMFELEMARLNAKKSEIAYDDKIIQLQTRKNELTKDLVSAQEDLNLSKLEFSYTLTADLDSYRSLAEAQLRDLLAKKATLNSVIESRKAIIDVTDSEERRLPLEIQLGQEIKSRVETEKAILAIREKLYSLPSSNFGDAFTKQLTRMRAEASKFFDDISTLVLDGVKDFAASMIKDLFSGNINAEIDKNIADQKFELEKLNQERQRSFNQVNQFRRGESETNDEYLARVRRLEEIQGQQADVYTFQTKELEILQKINELEQQRNNIILDRLKSLGEKIFDKLLDSALNGLIGGLGRGSNSSYGGGTYEEYTPPGNRPSTGNLGGINPILPRMSNSTSYNIVFSGPVYGADDFDRRVDSAVRKFTERRRG